MGLGAGVHHIGAESFETVFQKGAFLRRIEHTFFFASFSPSPWPTCLCASPSGAGLLASSSWNRAAAVLPSPF